MKPVEGNEAIQYRSLEKKPAFRPSRKARSPPHFPQNQAAESRGSSFPLIWITLPRQDDRGVCVGNGGVDDHEGVLILERLQKPLSTKQQKSIYSYQGILVVSSSCPVHFGSFQVAFCAPFARMVKGIKVCSPKIG